MTPQEAAQDTARWLTPAQIEQAGGIDGIAQAIANYQERASLSVKDAATQTYFDIVGCG